MKRKTLDKAKMLFSDPFLFAISLIDNGAILFLHIYYIITLTDLESDYLNAQECCSKLNFWITPKLMAHTVLLMLLLMHGHFLLTFFNLPLAIWLFYEIANIPKGNFGVYDPMEILNGRTFRKHLRASMINIGFYLVTFFLYLYCMINALLEDNPIHKEDNDLLNEVF